jgi:hypothetical protein
MSLEITLTLSGFRSETIVSVSAALPLSRSFVDVVCSQFARLDFSALRLLQVVATHVFTIDAIQY